MMIVLSTFPDIGAARGIASALVSEGLAACVNLIPQVESIYLWKGEMQTESEVLAIFKTREDRFAALQAALAERHPYDVPEIVGIAVDAVGAGYLAWILGRD